MRERSAKSSIADLRVDKPLEVHLVAIRRLMRAFVVLTLSSKVSMAASSSSSLNGVSTGPSTYPMISSCDV